MQNLLRVLAFGFFLRDLFSSLFLSSAELVSFGVKNFRDGGLVHAYSVPLLFLPLNCISPSWCHEWNVPKIHPEFWMLQETWAQGFGKSSDKWWKGDSTHHYGNQQEEYYGKLGIQCWRLTSNAGFRGTVLRKSSILLNMHCAYTVNRYWVLAIPTPGSDTDPVHEEWACSVIQTNFACLVEFSFRVLTSALILMFSMILSFPLNTCGCLPKAK